MLKNREDMTLKRFGRLHSGEGEIPPPHYYGDVVRMCLIVASFLLLITVLVDRQLIEIYLSVGVLAVLLLVILAGFTSPRMVTVMYIETFVAGVGFLFFEYAAIGAFLSEGDYANLPFLFRQAMAIVLLIALYYGTKSLRWLNQTRRDTLPN